MLRLEEIIEIIKTIDQSSIRSFELEQEATKLVISKDAPCPPAAIAVQSRNFAGRKSEDSAAGVPEKQEETGGPQGPAVHTITAPMVGTFYAAAEPGSDPFVEIGQKVNPGTVVCVVEAMKLFNEIEAEVAGEIVEILVKNEEFVEYGQPLFRVRPE